MLVAELNRTRRLGCEYEMTVPLVGTGSGSDIQQTLANVLTANGLRAISRGYSHDALPAGVDLAVEYDASVRGESRWAGIQWFAVEVKTRILNGYDQWEQIVPKALDICRYLGARVNPSCGHHIHLAFDEAGVQKVRSLWNLFHRFDQVIFGLVAPSRRDNQYCQHLPSDSQRLHNVKTMRNLRRALSSFARYDALNLTHLFTLSPHIELRHHQGTLDVVKARHWLRFCLQLVQHAVTRNCQAAETPVPNDRKGLDRLLTTAGFKVNTKVYAKVSPELRETGRYLLRRWKKLNATQLDTANKLPDDENKWPDDGEQET